MRDDEKEYVCSKAASCRYKLCVYHSAHTAAQAERWSSLDGRCCYPKTSIPLDMFVVVAEEQPA